MPYSPIQLFFDSLRPSCESQLLSEFTEIQNGEKALEIGCGNGFISLVLAHRFPKTGKLTGIDVNQTAITQSSENLLGLLSITDFVSPVEFILHDARKPLIKEGSFEVIVSNPPFFAEKKSRLSPDPSRRIARQDTLLTLDALFEAATQCLKPQGRLYLVLPTSRTAEIHALCNKKGFDEILIKSFPEIRKRSGGISLFLLQSQNFLEIGNGA